MARRPRSRGVVSDKELSDGYLFQDHKDAADDARILDPIKEGVGDAREDSHWERNIYASCSSDQSDKQHALTGDGGDISSPEDKGSWETIWDSRFSSPQTDSPKGQPSRRTGYSDEDIVFINNVGDGAVNMTGRRGAHGQPFAGNSSLPPSTSSPADSQSSESSPTSTNQDPRHTAPAYSSSASSSSSSQPSFSGLPSALRSKPIDIRRKKSVLIQLDNATIVAPSSDYESNEDPISCESAILEPRSPPQYSISMPHQNPFASIFGHRKKAAPDQKTGKDGQASKDLPSSSKKKTAKLDPRQKASILAMHPSDSDVSSLDIGPALEYENSKNAAKENKKAAEEDMYSAALSSSDMSFTNEHPISSRDRRPGILFGNRPTLSRPSSTSAFPKMSAPARLSSSNLSVTSFPRGDESSGVYATTAPTGNTLATMMEKKDAPEEAEKTKDG
ncbi:hypothetical protein VTN00DRAFT_6648 [Thermoascus crustaceus]|uniref:uncharacterized protein n=1 Tax=Thermoascus crustaceus TaxID=5088 RepID=UPI00374311B4